MYNPTQSTLVSIEPTSIVAKPVSTGWMKKKVAKRKTYPSKPKAKKIAKFDTSSQKESIKDFPKDSGHPLTPPDHSSEVPFGVLKPLAHTHVESPHNPPSHSQQGEVGVEQSSLQTLEHTHESSQISLLFLLHKHDSRSMSRIPSFPKLG